MKQCRYCKAENSDQATECVSCGLSLEFAEQIPDAAQEAQDAELTEEQVEAQRKAQEEAAAKAAAVKKKKRRIILATVAGVLAVAILAVVLSQTMLQTNSKFTFPEVNLRVAYNYEDNTSVLIADTKVVGEPVKGKLACIGVNLDGTIRLFEEIGSSPTVEDNKVYVATKEGLSYFADACHSMLAKSGNGVAYVNEELQLYLQSLPMDTEPVLISEQLVFYTSFELSPDGKTVAYLEEEAGEEVLYVCCEGERTRIGSGLTPVAISNQGEYLYCTSADEQILYLANAQGRLTEVVDNAGGAFIRNQDNTQMMFSTEDDTWHVLDHGRKRDIVNSEAINDTVLGPSVIMPEYAYGVENLTGHYYESTEKVGYLDKNWEFHAITEKAELGPFCKLSQDGNTLYFVEEDKNLYRVDTADLTQKEQLTKDVAIAEIAITADGEAVYYLDEENTLWYQEGTGSAVKITEGLHSLQMTHDDYLLFLEGQGAWNENLLYAVKAGGTPKLVADKVCEVNAENTATYYYRAPDEGEDIYELYGIEKGVDVRFITKDQQTFLW